MTGSGEIGGLSLDIAISFLTAAYTLHLNCHSFCLDGDKGVGEILIPQVTKVCVFIYLFFLLNITILPNEER